MSVKPKIALVITGSVAAIKTGELAACLKTQGFDVAYKVTDAAWQFVEANGKYKISDEQLTEIRAETDTSNSDITLVAPASADYISQMANGKIVFSGDVFVAPAMNFMMWQHPATQANVHKLIEQGVKFLGPVLGPMACKDYGYGRFAEVNAIAAAISDQSHLLHKSINDSLFANLQIPMAVKPNPKKILFIAHENNNDTPSIIRNLQSKGYQVKCVAKPGVDTSNFGIEVCTEHYQLNTSPPGMEHIRLPEWADILLVHPTNSRYLEEMETGSATNFIGCVYLASKAPVFVISTEQQPVLEKHGVRILENYLQLDIAIKEATKELAGKHYLVLTGSPRERVDSFRFYANGKRAEDHGFKAASELVSKGALVSVICPAHSNFRPDGAIINVNGKKIESASDMLAAAQKITAEFDGVLQLANISQLRCPNPVGHKISKTSNDAPNLFEVMGNIDIVSELRTKFSQTPIIGYDVYQERFAVKAVEIPVDVKKLCANYEKNSPIINSPSALNHSAKFENSKKRIVITTSRTEEALTEDGVIITNAFSGRQGQALATAFVKKGWEVVLISGPTNLPDLPDVRNIHVTSMAEMLKATQIETVNHTDAYISAAAIADFSVAEPLAIKLKTDALHTLIMQENASIIGTVAKSNNRPSVVISFAAQSPETILEYATKKFSKLGVDLTVANPIGAGTPAATDPNKNKVYFITADGVDELPVMQKSEVADAIAEKVEEILVQKKLDIAKNA